MVLQSIVLYSTLILIMVSCAKLFALKQAYQLSKNDNVKETNAGIFYLAFILLSFSILMGLRYDVGTDFFAYQKGYIYNIDVGKGEVIFNWIRELFNRLDFHFSTYFTFLAFLNISFFVFAFKKNAFILPLLLFFLITNGDWLFWMNGVRQALAMCIWIYALQFIDKNKFWSYLIWCIIAIGFHTSAIILIPFYFILRNGKDYFKSIKVQLLLFAGAFLLQYLFGTFLNQLEPLIEFYQSKISGGVYNYKIDRFREEASATSEGSDIAYFFRIALSVVIMFLSKKLKIFYNSKWFLIIYFLFFVGKLTENIFPVGSIVLTRPFRYFFIFEAIMFAYFVYFLLKSKSQNYNIVGVLLIVIFLALFYLNIMSASENSHLWYQFYFQ
jgi:hypothetical protein